MKYPLLAPLFLLLIIGLSGCHETVVKRKFITFGHSYFTLQYDGVWEAMMQSIALEHADYVIGLGDFVEDGSEEEWAKVNSGLKSLGTKYFLVPGNHDLYFKSDMHAGIDNPEKQKIARDRFESTGGKTNDFFKDESANYIMINTNDSLSVVKVFLDGIWGEVDTALPVFWFAHHFGWANVKKDKDTRNWAFPGVSRTDLLPWLKKVDYAFFGDWNHDFYERKIDGYLGVQAGWTYQEIVFFMLSLKLKMTRY